MTMIKDTERRMDKHKQALERHKKMLALYQAGGVSHHDVMDKTGYSYPTVVAFFNQHKYLYKLPAVPRKWYRGREPKLNDHLQQAYADYKAGLSLAQVGKKYGGYTREHVKRVFLRKGLKVRDKKQTARLRRRLARAPVVDAATGQGL